MPECAVRTLVIAELDNGDGRVCWTEAGEAVGGNFVNYWCWYNRGNGGCSNHNGWKGRGGGCVLNPQAT